MRAADSLHRELRAAVAAITFLTHIPLGRRVALDEADVARGALLFPVIGSGVGAAVGGAALLFHAALPAFTAAALALVLGAVLTGGLHLDGLADTADALGAPGFALAAALGAGFRRWLGGLTGDALGAAVELTETVALLTALALS